MSVSLAQAFERHLQRWKLPESWKGQLKDIVSTTGCGAKIQFWSGGSFVEDTESERLDNVLDLIDIVDECSDCVNGRRRLILIRNFSGTTFDECVAEADVYLNFTLGQGGADILYPNWGDTVYDLLQLIFAMVDFNGKLSSKLPRSNRWPMRGLAAARVKQFCLGLSQLDCNVLISGPSGIGKEAIARYIHSASNCLGAFVSVSIPSIPSELFSGVLFGYEKGSYTGAYHDQRGCFELAENGTLFLDEVADMEPRQQAALLRVLSERQGCSIGGTRTYPVTCRIVAATNRHDVMRMSFRPDLRIRLAEEEIAAAENADDWQPLRSLSLIRDHIPLLFAMQYVRCYHEQIGFERFVQNISLCVLDRADIQGREAYRCLSDNSWKMNYRELNQVALHALLRSLVDGQSNKGCWRIVLKLKSRYDQTTANEVCSSTDSCPEGVKLWDYLSDTARYQAICRLSSGNNPKRVAEMLGVDRSSITRFLIGYRKRYTC